MFTTNATHSDTVPLSASKQAGQNIRREWSQSEKRKTINLLRCLNIREVINWRVPYERFAEELEKEANIFSLLVTLFEITEDPQWRSRASHICTIIKKLHNICIETYGCYLAQLNRIEDYHPKLINIFYLNDPQLQQHFKNLVKIYLNQNSKYQILDEPATALGLIDSARSQKIDKIPEYLWIISQIKTGEKCIGKVLKLAQECINSNAANKAAVILPTLTILSNYVYHENRSNILLELLDNTMFQNTLILSLQTTSDMEISREALLLCNNILAKSRELSAKLMSSSVLMNAAAAVNC